ncbi:NAD-dependent epimerase/dehydratase family protein [Methanothrix sp.]|uniref:NAD-dependent epimerase/dehydratase family protein n=1 Tax=Methanothrix sp. TaxID=90426 RepID=UPI003451D2D0
MRKRKRIIHTLSKLLGEELCRSYHEDFGIKCAIFRPFNIYGPGQRADFLYQRSSPPFLGRGRGEDPEPKRVSFT